MLLLLLRELRGLAVAGQPEGVGEAPEAGAARINAWSTAGAP